MIRNPPERGGWLEVVCGPMFSGKSEELIRRLRRAEIAGQRVLVVKAGIDDRYDVAHVVSHAEQGYTANLPLEVLALPRISALRQDQKGDAPMRVMVIVKASKESEAGILPGKELLSKMGKYNEELGFRLVEVALVYGQRSIFDKKEERLKDVAKFGEQFKRKYPESKYFGSVDPLIKKAEVELASHQKLKKEYDEALAKAREERGNSEVSPSTSPSTEVNQIENAPEIINNQQ